MRPFFTLAVLVAGAACGAGPSVEPVTPAPTPLPAPAPVVAPPALTFGYRAVRAVVRMTAQGVTSEAGADSQRVASNVLMTLDIADSGAALSVSGRLDSISINPSRLPQAGTGFTRLLLPMEFGGELGAQGRFSIRIASDSGGRCWSEARMVLDPLAALFPTIPRSVSVGERWQDSVEIRTCRVGIPVTVREVRTFVLDRIAADGAGVASYVAHTDASGSRSGREGSVTYEGRGEARGTLVMDAGAGVVRSDEREGTYRVSIAVDGRARELLQQSSWRADVTVAP